MRIEQRIGRIDRYGQASEKVLIFNFITPGIGKSGEPAIVRAMKVSPLVAYFPIYHRVRTALQNLPLLPGHARDYDFIRAPNAKLALGADHGLRHTHATLLIQSGENAKVVQERLGHADITMTLGTYSSVMPGMQEGATKAIARLLFQGQSHIIHTKGGSGLYGLLSLFQICCYTRGKVEP